MDPVRPGDVIRAQDFNALVAAVEELRELLPDGLVVPSFVGQTLRDVRVAFGLPGSVFKFGTIHDSVGESVNPALASNDDRIVLNQVPPPGSRVSAKTVLVDLAVSARFESSSAPEPPRIERLFGEIDGALVDGEVRIGSLLHIAGRHFASPVGANTVSIDGRSAVVSASSRPPRLLIAVVPDTVPPPTGGADTRSVDVRVQTAAGEASATVDVRPPPEVDAPYIGSIDPPIAVVGATITLTGTGFDDTVRVLFGNATDPGSSALVVATPLPGGTATRIRVSVPDGISGVVSLPIGDSMGVGVRVRRRSDGVLSPIFDRFEVERLG